MSVLPEGETRYCCHIHCTLRLKLPTNQEYKLEIMPLQNKIANFIFCVPTPDSKAPGPRGHKREFFRTTRECVP